MSVKHGPVTLLSVVEGRDGISFLLAEGESVPGPVLNIGNINSRYRFPLPARNSSTAGARRGLRTTAPSVWDMSPERSANTPRCSESR